MSDRVSRSFVFWSEGPEGEVEVQARYEADAGREEIHQVRILEASLQGGEWMPIEHFSDDLRDAAFAAAERDCKENFDDIMRAADEQAREVSAGV